MAQSLAVKYRPKSWEDVTEQSAIKTILRNQLETGDIRNAYLFCGGAGTGKTTCARIFANEINHGAGNPIEMDAASNNSVDDVRQIAEQAKTRSLDSEYKIFILDECHSLSNSAWQAMLKLIEEPPAKSIFIFCTTDPQKIPKTILSRVQRYDFRRISQRGIVDRLRYILQQEDAGTETIYPNARATMSQVHLSEALDYIAKIADGGMRDAITMLDKCLAYSGELTIDNVVKALGVADYNTMIRLTDAVQQHKKSDVLQILSEIHADGKDMKQFVTQYMQFILNCKIYTITRDTTLTALPETDDVKKFLSRQLVEVANDSKMLTKLLDMLVKLGAEIKWDSSPKAMIQTRFLLLMETNYDWAE